MQRTALECSLAKYGLSLAPCTSFDAAPEAPTSPRLDASRALRAKLTPEGSRRVEVRLAPPPPSLILTQAVAVTLTLTLTLTLSLTLTLAPSPAPTLSLTLSLTLS